jgi:hypothetical protein
MNLEPFNFHFSANFESSNTFWTSLHIKNALDVMDISYCGFLVNLVNSLRWDRLGWFHYRWQMVDKFININTISWFFVAKFIRTLILASCFALLGQPHIQLRNSNDIRNFNDEVSQPLNVFFWGSFKCISSSIINMNCE